MTQANQLTYTLHEGNNIDVLKTFPDNSFDSVVTDPPYGIDFLGKEWDSNTGSIETYKECLRVLKPGGHLLAFSAARTYHHLAMSVELAGFEIRDQIMWVYSSGFPKSQDVGRSIQRGLGVKKTRKNPNARTLKGDSLYEGGQQKAVAGEDVVCSDPIAQQWAGWGTALKPAHEPIVVARKPLKLSVARNVQLHGTGALNIDASRVERSGEDSRFPSNVVGELPAYQKYFYCPKVSRRERHIGYDLTTIPTDPGGKYDDGGYSAKQEELKKDGNNHPTVKPQALMEYLIRLVTPAGGRVLDPFNGSGSTGMAAVKLGHHYTGIDLDPAYIAISERRISAWNTVDNTYSTLFEEDAK